MISSKTYIALTKFVVVGGLSFIIDMGFYYVFSQITLTFIAKSLGVGVATLFNYKCNKYWTWESKKSKTQLFKPSETLKKYLVLYTLSGLINVISNEFFLQALPDWELQLNMVQSPLLTMGLFAVKFDKLAAVLGATALGMGINFLGQKLWVFVKTHDGPVGNNA